MCVFSFLYYVMLNNLYIISNTIEKKDINTRGGTKLLFSMSHVFTLKSQVKTSKCQASPQHLLKQM